MYVVTVTAEQRSRKRHYTSADEAVAAVERRVSSFRQQGFARTGGRPQAGSLVTAYLRPKDRRRHAAVVITAEPTS